MTSSKLVKRIQKFNRDRDPELLRLKFQKMQVDPFVFFRGSCHLFYEDFPNHSALNSAPKSWICGDLHLENFGSYKGDNRLTYFDLNDFDEAILAPCTWEIARLVTSIFLAFPSNNNDVELARSLGEIFLTAYANNLIAGKARWVEREIAEGLVKNLLDEARKIDREEFLEKRTVLDGKQRQILIKENKTRPVSEATKEKIKFCIEKFASQQPEPEFFRVIDIAWRIAGTGSLGLERYMVLVEGKGSPDRNYILDLKAATESSLAKYVECKQPRWQNQAERVVTIQKRMQAISMALLNTVAIDGKSYIIREYQPTEDKIELSAERELKDKELTQLMQTFGQIVASAQLRSSGRQGSAIADELIDFAKQDWWCKEVMAYAHEYSQKVATDWQEFCQEVQIIEV
ncbi:MAG: DUF2252 domain-containing protein [Cyanosarcina radialis HA8281-LM2]|jgi:uncharacterized protein (DUF2252 family)|nr:DUF2252 domain-containing protein [Cyanosarcina radialis HA8281-LM2]